MITYCENKMKEELRDGWNILTKAQVDALTLDLRLAICTTIVAMAGTGDVSLDNPLMAEVFKEIRLMRKQSEREG